jgi:hypothetical protein
MAHLHSTQRFIAETLNQENLSYIHYIEFHHSLYNIYNAFSYFVDTKTLIPKTGIIFSKLLKITKSSKNSENRPKKKIGALLRTLCITRGGAYSTPPPPPPPRKHLMHTAQTEHYYEGSSDAVVISDAPTHTHA